MTQKTTINFREAVDVIQAVDQAAETSGSNRSTFIREAIRQKLKEGSDEALEKYKKFR